MLQARVNSICGIEKRKGTGRETSRGKNWWGAVQQFYQIRVQWWFISEFDI